MYCCERNARFSKAEPWLREIVMLARKSDGEQSAGYASGSARLGINLLAQKTWTDAETVTRKCVPLRETLALDPKSGTPKWRVANGHSMLGNALLGQQKYAKAETSLLKGFEGLKEQLDKILPDGQPRSTATLDRVTELYTATGRDAGDRLGRSSGQKHLSVSRFS